jgi:hypothetical protein
MEFGYMVRSWPIYILRRSEVVCAQAVTSARNDSIQDADMFQAYTFESMLGIGLLSSPNRRKKVEEGTRLGVREAPQKAYERSGNESDRNGYVFGVLSCELTSAISAME